MIDISGMDELQNNYNKLKKEAPYAASFALYEGARIVADAVSSAVNGIRTAPFKYAKNGEKRLPSPEEKAAIVGSPHGVSRFRKKLERIDTSVGWNQAGYVDVNFNHMSSKARTNYKKQAFKNKESMTTSTLKAAGVYKRGVQNQKPVGAIAGAINSGTSFMQKQPFMRKAFSKSKAAALAAIEGELRRRIEELNLD